GSRNSPASPCLVTLPPAGPSRRRSIPALCSIGKPAQSGHSAAHSEPRLRRSFPSTKDWAAPSGSLSEGAACLYCGMIVRLAASVGRVALALVDLLEVGIHNLLVATLAGLAAILRTTRTAGPALPTGATLPTGAAFGTGLGLVELLADLHRDLRQRLG